MNNITFYLDNQCNSKVNFSVGTMKFTILITKVHYKHKRCFFSVYVFGISYKRRKTISMCSSGQLYSTTKTMDDNVVKTGRKLLITKGGE